MRLTLKPHPDTPCEAVREIAVDVAREGMALSLKFDLSGDVEAIAFPERRNAARADELWRHTCFEAFLKPLPDTRSSRRKSGPSDLDEGEECADQSEPWPGQNQLSPDFRRDERGGGYVEINLSPSNQWAIYAFGGYREGMRSPDGVERRGLDCQITSDRFVLTTTFDLDRLDILSSAQWRLGLSAVIELKDGPKSYWALAHAPGQPDFHHPDAFAVTLPAESP